MQWAKAILNYSIYVDKHRNELCDVDYQMLTQCVCNKQEVKMPDYYIVPPPSAEDWDIGCKLLIGGPILIGICAVILFAINGWLGRTLGWVPYRVSALVVTVEIFFNQIGRHNMNALLLLLLIILISGLAFFGALFGARISQTIGGCIFLLVAVVCFVIFVGSLAIGGWEFFFF